MSFTSKLSPEQWAEARRMRAGGATCDAIARHFQVNVSAIYSRASKEGWPTPGGKPARAKAGNAPSALQGGYARAPSPATATIRSRLALRLYKIIECKIRMLEMRMTRELQAHESADGVDLPPIADERESIAALIASINQVTEMASDPATAPDGKRNAAAAGSARDAINPELTALSADIEPDGLAAASQKDQFRRDLAEHLGKMFPKP